MARGYIPPLALAYHGIADVSLSRDPDRLFVRPQDLRRQIERLRKWNYRLVSFGDLAEEVARAGAVFCQEGPVHVGAGRGAAGGAAGEQEPQQRP